MRLIPANFGPPHPAPRWLCLLLCVLVCALSPAAPAARWRTHTLVCGHWSALGYRTADHVIALDSGCLWGGELTAVRLEDRAVFQVPCERCAKF